MTKDLAHTEYVDNFVCMSQDASLPRNVAEQVERELLAVGLPTHGVEFSQGGTTLGWTFADDVPIIVLAPRLRWKIRLGLLEVLRRDHCAGDELRRVVAHFTALALSRRELLSALGGVYLFSILWTCYGTVVGHAQGSILSSADAARMPSNCILALGLCMLCDLEVAAV